MNLTLKEALTMSPLDEATLIAGFEGIDKPVTLFGILDAPDSFKFVRPGEFVVTTGYIFRDTPGLEDIIVKELHHCGAAGLGIKFNRYISNLPLETLEYANKNNFPVVSLPNKYSWYEISLPILISCTTDRKNIDADILEILNDYSEKLFNVSDPLEILKLLFQLTNKPCSIFSTINKSQIFHFPTDFTPDQDIQTVINQSSEEGAKLLFPPQYDSVIVSLQDKQKSHVVISRIRHWNNSSTYLLIWVGDSILSKEQMIILQYAINSFRLRFNELSNPRKEFLKKQNDLLFRLLFEDIQNADLIFSQANQLGITLSSEYIIAVAELSSKPPPSFLQEGIHSKLEDFFYRARTDFNVFCGFGKFGELFFLIPVCNTSRTDDQIKMAKNIITNLKTGLEKHFSNIIFSFGIGKYHPKLSGLKSSFQEAVTSLKLGAKVFGYGTVTHFSDLGVYRLLNNPSIQQDLKSFMQDYFIPLLDYDRLNKSELVKTLSIFFETGRSNRKCAQKMFAHHNTIRYRLEQVEQICNLDFSKPNDILILELALKAVTLIDEKPY